MDSLKAQHPLGSGTLRAGSWILDRFMIVAVATFNMGRDGKQGD